MRSAKAIPFPTYCAYLSGVLAAIIGGAGLLGWAMDVQWLTALWPQLQAMRPNAALAMLLSGLALLLMLPYPPAAWRRWIGRSLAVVILLMAGVALFSIFTGIDIPSNAMLFHQDKFPVASVGPERFPMRMGLPAAVGFLLTALALLLLDMKPRGGWSASQFLSLATTTVGGLGLLGHAYNAAILYQLTTYTVISAHIALGLVCMGVGLLLARPNLFPAAMLLSRGSSGTVGRRLLLPIVLGPAVLGLLWMDLVQQNWLSSAEAMAGLVILIVLMLMGLTWWCMAAVARVDRQRDQAEAALRESERFVKSVAEASPHWFYVFDFDTMGLTYANRPILRDLGYPPDVQTTATRLDAFRDFMPPEEMPHLSRLIEEWRFLPDDLVRDDEYQLRHADGTLHYFAGREIVFIRRADGTVRQILGSLLDITAHKQAEADLSTANERLREADRRKDEFLAMLAHELRNPLAPVRNAIQVLRLAGDREDIRQRQQNIVDRQVTHMARLLDDLLDVSRVTRGKIDLRRQELDLTDVLAHAVETTAPLIESRRHTLHVAMPPASLRVGGDIDRLAQVIGNLLVNSAKYTDAGGQIWLSAGLEEGQAVARVRDNGVGIAPELLPHVFDLFAQADNSLGRAQGGLGIGLTMVQNLVRMHGGTVEARSAGLGQGSEFIVCLPALDAEPASIGEVPARPVASGNEAAAECRVMIVDDIADSAESLAELAALWGHETRAVHSGVLALEVARDFRPDVALLDIGMPGMDGFELARRLRAEHGPNLMLVALTGYGQSHDREATREAGFDRHLVKPVDLEDLRALLGRPRD